MKKTNRIEDIIWTFRNAPEEIENQIVFEDIWGFNRVITNMANFKYYFNIYPIIKLVIANVTVLTYTKPGTYDY